MRDLLFPVCQAFVQRKKDGRNVEIRASLSNKASKQYQALSGPMLDHMHMFLSSLRCWTPANTAALPWTTVVRYTIAGGDVTPPGSGGEEITLDVDERGETGGIVATRTSHISYFKLANAGNDDMFLRISLVETIPGRRCLRKGAMYANTHVERFKVFTYRSKFRWNYRSSVRWMCPEIEALAESAADTDLVFRKAPSCSMVVICDELSQNIDDVGYLADSLLCKVMDLLPTEYRNNVKLQSIADRTAGSVDAAAGDVDAASTEMVVADDGGGGCDDGTDV